MPKGKEQCFSPLAEKEQLGVSAWDTAISALTAKQARKSANWAVINLELTK